MLINKKASEESTDLLRKDITESNTLNIERLQYKDTNICPFWMNYEVPNFSCYSNNIGEIRTFRQVLLSDFATPHKWFYKDDATGQWINGESNDLHTIINLRSIDHKSPDYDAKKLQAKRTIQCIMTSAVCDYKKKGSENIIKLNPFLQLDIDNLHEYDIEEIRQALLDLPFVCWVQKSVSGFGLWALCLIEEPEKLAYYAEHCFYLFEKYQIPIDTGKGMNPLQLRFLSWDENVKWNDNPKPLKIKRFNSRKVEVKPQKKVYSNSDSSGLIRWAITQVANAQKGQRFETVRKISYTLGGHNTGLSEVKAAIENSSQYQGVVNKYLRHADEAFIAGRLNPIL